MRPGLAGDLIARLGQTMRRLLHPNWPLFRSSESADERIVARQGPVEIRRTLACWSLETCVKGEPDCARATALRRLANYANGRNRDRTRLRVARPLVQSAESTGRWRVRVALPDLHGDFAAVARRNGKVRLRAHDAETLAVIRVTGRPSALAVQHAETAIRHAIAPTYWQATGAAMLRLHTLPAALPFLGRFEVAVPVTERFVQPTTWDRVRQMAFHQSTTQERATRSCPPMR